MSTLASSRLGSCHRPAIPSAWVALVATAIGCGTGAPEEARAPAPPAAGLRAVPQRADASSFLAADARRAVAAGAGPLVVLGSEFASEGDRVGGFVDVPPGSCLLAMARTSSAISDVDLFAYEEDGDALATDESPDADPGLVLCPTSARRLWISARVMTGAGLVGVGVQSVPQAAADAVARAVAARGRPGDESGRLDAWPGLETKIREHRAALGSRWEDVRRVALPVDPHAASRISFSLEANRCIDLFVTPSDEVASLEVVVEDARGRVVARAREHQKDRFTVLCSSSPQELTLAIRPRATQGLVAVVVGRSPLGTEAEIASHVVVDRPAPTLELRDATAAHERRLAGRFQAAKTVATGSARVGSRVTVPVEVPKGCARIDVIAGKPMSDVLVGLWDEKHSLIDERRGGGTASVFSCGPGGKLHADVEALSRPGPFAVELRPERSSPAALVAHPVAAARLLGRIDAAGEVASAATAENARAVTLDASRKVTVPVTVAANTCVEVIVALESGAGLELGLSEDGGAATRVTRSRHVASDRVCAGGSPKQSRVELRIASGTAPALVLARPVSFGP